MYFHTAHVACAGVIGILEARMRVGNGNQICFVLNFYFHVRVRIRVYIQFSNVCNFLVIVIGQFVAPCSATFAMFVNDTNQQYVS